MKKLTIAFITFFLLITTTAITDIVRAKSFVYYSWLGFLPRLIQISDLIFVGEIQSMTNLESTVRVDSCLYGDPGTNPVHLTRWIDWRKGWSDYAETLGPDSGPCVVFAMTNNWWSIFDTDASSEEKKLANRTLLTWDVVTNTPLDHGVFPGWTLPCANDSFYPPWHERGRGAGPELHLQPRPHRQGGAQPGGVLRLPRKLADQLPRQFKDRNHHGP